MSKAAGMSLAVEWVGIDEVRAHPRNYNVHPPEQIEHLRESLREHGWYRNVVTAKDLTILAGHGVWQAAREEGHATIPVVRMPLRPDEPRALKLLAADNTLRHLAEQDDRALSELLKEIASEDPEGLLGTGFDDAMLANLVFVTRPASEVSHLDEAARWVGFPAYDNGERQIRVVVNFRTREDLDAFVRLLGIGKLDRDGDATAKSLWWPPRGPDDDVASLKFVANGAAS